MAWRLRVLHVNKLYHPWIGGIARRALREAITALLQDRELRTRYVRAAHARPEMFSNDSVVRQIIDLYEGGAASR